MTPQDSLRHDVLTLRDLVETRGAESASITYTASDRQHTTLTYTRGLGAVLVAGERTLAIPEEWAESHGLMPVGAPCDQSAQEDRP
jgi:hypothetical protein